MITSILLFLIGCAYALAPTIAGGIDPMSSAADVARAIGPSIAGVAAMSAFPSARVLRFANVVIGIGLCLSPIVVPKWAMAALVIQVVVGLWVTGFALLPRARDGVVTGGGWKHVFSSPSTIDRIETSGGL